MSTVFVSSAAKSPNGSEPTKQKVFESSTPTSPNGFERTEGQRLSLTSLISSSPTVLPQIEILFKAVPRRLQSRSYWKPTTGCQPTATNQPEVAEKQDDMKFYWEMHQALEKDKERLIHDKKFWEFMKEGEEVMQVPEKEKIVASSFEKQKDFKKHVPSA